MYYSKAFLDAKIRNELKIKLDHESEIFQNLNGASDDVRVLFNDATGDYFVKNILTDNIPSLVHGNGPSKPLLNNFGCYVAGAFKHNESQLSRENKLQLSEVLRYFIFFLFNLKMLHILWQHFTKSNTYFFTQKQDNLPKVTIAITITKATPFLEEFFDSIYAFEYPKDKLNLFIYNDVCFQISQWIFSMFEWIVIWFLKNVSIK